MSVKTNLFFSVFLFVLLQGSLSLQARTAVRSSAQDDYMQVLICHTNTILDVFQNDAMIPCTRNEITLQITSGSNTGATTSVNSEKNIVYAPAAGFVGHDTLEYQVVCKSTVYEAKVFITVVGCPDNIVEVDCYGESEAFEWAIAQEWQSEETDIATYVSPIVGDLDGDGLPEIVVAKFHSYVLGLFRPFQNLYVYKGSDRSTPVEIPTPQGNFMQAGAMAMARVPVNGNVTPIIVMIDNLGYLRAYNPFKPGGVTNQNDYMWRSDATVFASYNNSVHLASVAFADFNNDGIPEIYIGNRIFDATTGKLLIDGPVAGNKGAINFSTTSYQYMPAVADIDGDGILEYIAGTQIYKVNIEQGTMTLLVEINQIELGGAYTIKDGNTFVTDINKDGYLDVIVTAHLTDNIYGIAVWDIRTETALATVTDASVSSSMSYQIGIPFIGDIDGNGEVEILLTSMQPGGGYINGYRWNGTSALERVYRVQTTDESGCTGITLFDFNQDGIMELVYRDMTHLRIMRANAGTGTFVNVATIPATSGTGFEYPIVVDVDSDGAAEIVVSGGTTTNAFQGTLRIYKSDNQHPWSPARKVWNQYAYNVVNINEDLTVPRYQMNPATVFPNGKQPFNNFLQQQTLLNTNGDSFWPLPNIAWSKEPKLTIDNNTAIFEGCVKNTGNAVLQAPIYVTFYKNDTTSANIITLHTIQKTLAAGDTLCFSLSINNWSSFEPINSVWISVNDRNGVYPYQNQCEEDGRRVFVIDSSLFHVNVTVNEPDYGSATGTGDYEAYSKAQVEAFVKDCYRFANWTIDSVVVSEENPYIFTVTQNVNIVANFYALDFDTYCPTLWENTFMLNLKKLREESYVVTGCKWFKNGIELTETNTINEFSYSAGPNQDDLLEPSPTYYTFELLTDNFGPLCSTKKTLTGSRVDKLIVYPNPVAAGAPITITGTIKDTPINVYNLYGVCVKTVMGEEGVVKLTLNLPSGIYFVRSNNKVVKVVVIK